MRFLLLLLAASSVPWPAYAYLDPGTGSMIVHLIIGAIAGGLVTLKLYWHRFKRLLNRTATPGDGGETDQ